MCMANLVSDLADGIKKLQQLSKDLSDIAFQEQILGLRSLLVEAQSELLDLRKDLADAISEKTAALDFVKFSKQLIEDGGYKYEAIGGEPKGLPYCPVCEAKSHLYIRLVSQQGAAYDRSCSNCKAVYGSSAKKL
jgi:hypothetical protein